ncbi:prepilin-type cleavage/methylation protein [Parvimonas sp. KA00067]|nr:prepilin-type cleavage/methylation protein [Parvimonas sp. KA00067]
MQGFSLQFFYTYLFYLGGFEMKNFKKKAFTLIELLVVIAILAILILIAVPRYNNSRVKADKTAHSANVRVLEVAGLRYLTEEKVEGDVDITEELVSKKYIKEIPKLPKSIKGTAYSVQVKNGDIVVTPTVEKDD